MEINELTVAKLRAAELERELAHAVVRNRQVEEYARLRGVSVRAAELEVSVDATSLP